MPTLKKKSEKLKNKANKILVRKLRNNKEYKKMNLKKIQEIEI